jgi:arylsulfatase
MLRSIRRRARKAGEEDMPVVRLLGALALVLIGLAPAAAQDALPLPDSRFAGFAGRTPAESDPARLPVPLAAPKGAPNVLVILTDDVGFAAGSTFGGPIPTPTQDALAAAGLRYTVFHTTGVCSPTRAALLTGRNHNRVGMGMVPEGAAGYDGYTSVIPRGAGTLAQLLKANGYNTAGFGKWHLTPTWEQSQAGPFDHWPTGLGFEYFYGFIGGATNQWAPTLIENTRPVEPPAPAAGEPAYIFDRDMADHAIRWIRDQKALAPDRPFFVYYATGTAHAPHQAPPDWIARFKGRFDQGWDKVREETLARQKAAGIVPPDTQLTPRPAVIPAWDSLGPDQKGVYAHLMEVHAAALAHADFQIGRVIDAIRQAGQLDNTLILYIQGDNGASSLGGQNGSLNDNALMNVAPETFEAIKAHIDEAGGPLARSEYPLGWGHAMDAPFQWHKAIASHFGGTRNGLTVTWPARIKDKGGIRTQFHHVIDVLPTVLEAAGVTLPASLDGAPQMPLDGRSMVYSFADKAAPSVRRTQYFLIGDSAGLYHDGWVAAVTPQQGRGMIADPRQGDLNSRGWELYHVAEDFSEAVNLAEKEPGKLRQLRDLFWVEAARNSALPIQQPNFLAVTNLNAGQKSFTYPRGLIHVPEGTAPDFKSRSYEIAADLDIPEGGADGMILTQGGRFGGFGLYLLQGRPVFHYNLYNTARYQVAGPDPIPAGRHALLLRFAYDGPGMGKSATASLLVDGRKVAESRFDRTMVGVVQSLDEGLEVGEDHGTPVSEDYRLPFAFTGGFKDVRITLQ